MTDTELLQALVREQRRTNELLEQIVRQQPRPLPDTPPPIRHTHTPLDRAALNQEYANQLKNALAGGDKGQLKGVVRAYMNSIGAR